MKRRDAADILPYIKAAPGNILFKLQKKKIMPYHGRQNKYCYPTWQWLAHV